LVTIVTVESGSNWMYSFCYSPVA